MVPHLTTRTLLAKVAVAHCENCVLYVVEAGKSNFILGRSDLNDVEKSADEALDASRSD
jgi:hypothetical protein